MWQIRLMRCRHVNFIHYWRKAVNLCHFHEPWNKSSQESTTLKINWQERKRNGLCILHCMFSFLYYKFPIAYHVQCIDCTSRLQVDAKWGSYSATLVRIFLAWKRWKQMAHNLCRHSLTVIDFIQLKTNYIKTVASHKCVSEPLPSL